MLLTFSSSSYSREGTHNTEPLVSLTFYPLFRLKAVAVHLYPSMVTMLEEVSTVTPPLKGLVVTVLAKVEFAESTALPFV